VLVLLASRAVKLILTCSPERISVRVSVPAILGFEELRMARKGYTPMRAIKAIHVHTA
jgi:hypothetical protein